MYITARRVPTVQQLKTVLNLIEAGVKLGHIKPQYKLVGHRQVRDTLCPGAALFEEVQSWDDYSYFQSAPVNITEF